MTNLLKKLLSLMAISILVVVVSSSRGQAEELIPADNALKKVFKGATDFKREEINLSPEQVADIESKSGASFDGAHPPRVVRYTATRDGETLGFAFEDTVMGKWGSIHYLAGIDPGGAILEVVVLGYQEIRGRPIAKARFLRQYKRKTVNDPLRLHKDIDGVTGATISSRSITDGIRKLIHIFNAIQSG